MGALQRLPALWKGWFIGGIYTTGAKWADEKSVLSSQGHKQPPKLGWLKGSGGRKEQAGQSRHDGEEAVLPPDGTGQIRCPLITTLISDASHWPHRPPLQQLCLTGLNRRLSRLVILSCLLISPPCIKKKKKCILSSSPLAGLCHNRRYLRQREIAVQEGLFQRGGINSSYLNHFVFLSRGEKRDIPSPQPPDWVLSHSKLYHGQEDHCQLLGL